MSHHTIQVSDVLYRQLIRQAKTEKKTMEQIVERLLSEELALLSEQDEIEHLYFNEDDDAIAWQAFHRLTTLFENVNVPDLEQAINDPMLELGNVNLNFESL